MIRNFFGLLFIFLTSVLTAQVEFYVKTDRDAISADERLRVDFVLNQKEDDFIPPAFKDFYVVMGPSVSQSYQWINGRESFSKTYTYIVQPKRKGILTIEPARVIVNGKTYQTEPLKIQVDKSNAKIMGKDRENEEKETLQTAPKKDIFLQVELTKSNPYAGEPIGVVYRLYLKAGTPVMDLQLTEIPDFEGFWAERLDQGKAVSSTQKVINGIPYEVHTIYKAMLIPQKTGVLKIKPLKLEVVTFGYEEKMFGPFVIQERVPKKMNLSSGSKIIRVKELPQTDKPAEFSGAVGKFDFDLFLEKDSVRTGEPVILKLKLTGKGNTNLIELPDIHLPPDIEVYEPEIKRNIKTTLTGYSGTVEKIYTLIPQKGGKYIIPPVKFSYFDPSLKKYVNIQTQEKILNVYGNNLSSGAAISKTGHGSKLLPLSTSSHWKNIEKHPFFGSSWFYRLHYFILMILIVGLGYKYILEKRLKNPVVLREKQTKQTLKKLLETASGQTGNKESFYGTLEKILTTYFKNKLNLKPVDLTHDRIIKELYNRQVDSKIIDELRDFWKKIQSVRYTPVESGDMQSDLQKIKNMLERLDKILK